MRVVLATACLCGLVFAQDIAVQYFQTTDDIRDAYNNGEITFEQYVELLQLLEDKIEVNTGNLRRLLVVPGVDRSDIEALERARSRRGPFRSLAAVKRAFPGDFALIEPFIYVVPPIRIKVKGYAKVYTRRDYASPPDYDDPYHSSKLYLRAGRFSLDYRLRQRGDEFGTTTFRAIEYRGEKIQAIVGNYYKDIGYGLLVGRYLSLSSSSRQNDGVGYLISPYYGDLNGLYVYWRPSRSFRAKLALSGNSYETSSQALAAASAAYRPSRNAEIGAVLYYGSVEDKSTSSKPSFTQEGASVFGEVRLSGWRLRNETGVLQNGAWGTQLFLYSPRRRGVSVTWTLWAYHPGFKALYSDGECDRRSYQSFYPENFSFYLKSYQAGELGGYFSARVPITRRLRGEVKLTYFDVHASPKSGGAGYIAAVYDAGWSGYARTYAERRWDGWGATGTTRDKVGISLRWTPSERVTIRNYSYFRWNQYSDGDWRNEFRVSNTVTFSLWRNFEVGVRAERQDYDVNDPQDGYWGIAVTPRIDIPRSADWKTELSFRRYDDAGSWSLQVRVNARVDF